MMQSSSLILRVERNDDVREKENDRSGDKKTDFQSLRQVLKVRRFLTPGERLFFEYTLLEISRRRYERRVLLCSRISFLEKTFSYFSTRIIFLGIGSKTRLLYIFHRAY